jgi:hypothetical protein
MCVAVDLIQQPGAGERIMESTLKLSIEDLAVDSFDAGEDDAFRRGTVQGHG